jgi:hypothetical protein
MDEFLTQFIDPQRDADVHTLAYAAISTAIGCGEVTIQDLIVKLETALTSADDKERHRATLLFADLLSDHPTLTFSSAVVHLLIVFFCRRLSDYPSLVPSLQAIKAIVAHHTAIIDPKYYDFVDICQSIFKDVYVQGLAQNIRQRVFELLLLMFTEAKQTHDILVSVEGMASEIFDGVLNCFEGEKDPRCLVVALQALTMMMKALEPHATVSQAEKLFEAVSVYFPITFQPPSNDPYGITPQLLTKCLVDCLCCHSKLVPHVLPFVCSQLEKSTDGTIARTQSETVELNASRKQGLMCLLSLCGHYSGSLPTGTQKMITGSLTRNPVMDALFECVSAEVRGEFLSNLTSPESCSSLFVIYSIFVMASSDSNALALLVENLLSKVFISLSDVGFHSVTGRNAFAVACAVCASSTTCSTAVMERIYPTLLSVQVSKDVDSVNRAMISVKASKDVVMGACGVASESNTSHIALLNELISCIGSSFCNPFTFCDEQKVDPAKIRHSCGSDNCSHGHSSHGDAPRDLDPERFTFRNSMPVMDLTTLSAANPMLAFVDRLVGGLLRIFENTDLLSSVEVDPIVYASRVSDFMQLGVNTNLNIAGFCEVILCLKSILVRWGFVCCASYDNVLTQRCVCLYAEFSLTS